MGKQEIKQLLEDWLSEDGLTETGMKGVRLFRFTEPHRCAPAIYEPAVVAIVGGAKEAIFDGESHIYDSDQYLCCSISMPIEAGIATASGIGLREEDRRMNDVLARQDYLYTLMTQHPDGDVQCEVVGSLVDFVLATDASEQAIEKMASPDTRIVSLTITEGGYNLNPSTGEFDFQNPSVQAEIQEPQRPITVFGYLTAALKKRKKAGLAPFGVLSCDNIQHNGDVARKMLLSFMKKVDRTLAEWMETEGSFPNSMVDRITPVTKQQDLEYLQKTFGLRDEWPVVCEPYIQWVVEDRFCNGRPPLEKVGVSFVPDVTPYEKMKIRLLNAGHSVLGIPGAVHGHQTINDCMEDEVLASFMRGFMDLEATPILGEIAGVDLKAYKDCLEQRFSNPNIKDGVSRICSESSAKLPKFLIPTIQENLENGGSIEHGAFVMACWCYYSHKGVDENGKPLEIIDNRKTELHESAKKYASDSLSFLRIPDIFGSLIENERFVEEYSRWLADIYRGDSIRGLMGQINSRTSDLK